MKKKPLLLEAKRNFNGVVAGHLYTIVDIDEYDNYSVYWYRNELNLADYVVFPTLSAYGDIFEVIYQN